MTTEDDDKISKSQEGEAAAPTNGASEPFAELEAPKKEEEKSSGGRMNAAKAFYRAMYAGEDAAPEDFGINMGGSPAGSGQSSAADTQRIRDLEQQVTELEAKNAETDTHMKRLAADFENYRRRTEKEREEFSANGALRAIEAILPALDDLDRAQMTLNPSMDPKNILESFKLVGNSFTRCLEQIGAKPLVVIGEPFDPRLHEPVQEIRTNEYPDSTVIHELRRGFMFKERVLRPALVNVTATLSEEEAAAEAEAKAKAAASAAAVEAPAEQQPAPAAEPTAADAVEAAPTASADQALQNLVKTDEKRAESQAAAEQSVDLTEAEPTSQADIEDTVQVYEISEEDAADKPEELAEAQPAQVSDD